jgi:thioredoxin-like negative regulator of GroEL
MIRQGNARTVAFVRTESIEGTGMNWASFRQGVSQFIEFAVEAAVINRWQTLIDNWARMSDEGAFESIAAQVLSSPEQDVHQLDAVLLMMASGDFNEQARRRLVKFYAVFKMAEMIRYQGFPPFPK